METIQISKENALKAYNAADKSQKSLLENLIGKELLVPQKITDRVKSFEDALAIVGCEENEKILLQYNGINKSIIAAQAFAKLSIIRQTLNEGWEPDWSDDDEYKWTPWFNMPSGSGSGFSFFASRYNCTGSSVGARLSYKSEELATYAGKQFIELYKDLFVL